MRISLKQLFALTAIAAVLCLCAMWLLRRPAFESWGYGRLGISQGTPQSPVYFLMVSGVGKEPSVARIVRFADRRAIPREARDVSHSAALDVESRTRNIDFWSSEFTVIAGRSIDEKVEISMDRSIGEKWFGRPVATTGQYEICEAFWNKYVTNDLPPVE